MPMLPQDQAVVITIIDSHIIVCRRRELSHGVLSYEPAQNAEQLEDEAMLVLASNGHPFQTGEEFPCPSELAARAWWS